MRAQALVIVVVAALGLVGCGKQETLAPVAGKAMPQKPATAPAQPTVAELLTPTTQARPERSDELLRQSERRRDDRFELPHL
ncbi:hypothetical protein [Sphingomonas quercus]|uniref:Argininosuccinate lyase n=1 Tax=Sphingomonas quercus TaxID=2842451 RepID=A0ABS6BF16_9SPHN|nr:hypothetical protein [Sphingomonas quercus]MBU3076903.1 hypothetical protein [Sphingomonas quercus]